MEAEGDILRRRQENWVGLEGQPGMEVSSVCPTSLPFSYVLQPVFPFDFLLDIFSTSLFLFLNRDPLVTTWLPFPLSVYLCVLAFLELIILQLRSPPICSACPPLGPGSFCWVVLFLTRSSLYYLSIYLF